MLGRITSAWVLVWSFVHGSSLLSNDPFLGSTSTTNYLASTSITPARSVLANHRELIVRPTLNAHELPSPVVDVVREVYVWAWPMVYLSNLKSSLEMVRAPGVSGGAPVAPINSLCMLTNVVSANFRSVPCPNPDVIYGFGMMALEQEPVVIQVPDFGDQFWIYQIGDHRMESFGNLGSLYGTQPGFYLVVGPNWHGDVPEGITAVLRSPTNLAYVLPRVLAPKNDSDDRATRNVDANVLSQIVMYPVSRHTGRVQRRDWSRVRWYPAIGRSNRERSRLVSPTEFFDDLEQVIEALPASAMEAPLVEVASQLIRARKEDSTWESHLQRLAERIEADTIAPMFDFSSSGQQLPGGWRTLVNGAAFGDDYWTRTAVAKSNPFVNRAEEAKYYFLENDATSDSLHGNQVYQLTFAADQLPPTDSFWSLTAYDAHHQLPDHTHGKYSICSSAPDLKRAADGSITIVIGGDGANVSPDHNWLPMPAEEQFSLYLRIYAPRASAIQGEWTPPAVRPSGT